MRIATPQILTTINHPPKELYIKGEVKDDLKAVAIVGSRRPTKEGSQIAYQLAYDLAAYSITVVSGLAMGIDAQAHRGALDGGGATIAVLPSGIKDVYPATNHALAQQILKSGGAIISERDGHYRPMRHDFLARNRLIAGLTAVTVVVEAAQRSGALNTAYHALNSSREVMAVPGSIYNPLAVGTNNLIKQGATPVTGVEDVLNMLGLELKQATPETLAASPEELIVIKALKDSVLSFEELTNNIKLPLETLQATLSMLEIKSVVVRLPGNYLKLKG